MGTWGIGSFENDDAWDWVSELERGEHGELIEQTLDAAQPGPRVPDAIDGALCIVAAEAVAAWIGRPAHGLPEEIGEWIDRQGAAPFGLCERALRGLHQVVTDSGLRDMWSREGRLSAWVQHVSEIERRLRSVSL